MTCRIRTRAFVLASIAVFLLALGGGCNSEPDNIKWTIKRPPAGGAK